MAKINKHMALLALLAAALLIWAGCARQGSGSASPTPQAKSTQAGEATGTAGNETADAGGSPLIIATCADYPPFEFELDGQLTGVDISLAEYIAKQLGRPLQLQEMPFEDTMTAVEEGRAHMAIAAIIPTEERGEHMAFSQPYYTTGKQCVVTTKANEGRFSTTADLSGAVVAVANGNVALAQLVGLVPEEGLLRCESEYSAVDALAGGQADAAAVSMIVGKVLCSVHPDELVMTEVDLGEASSGELCVALPKDDEKLLKAVNDAVSNAHKLELPPRWMDNAIEQAARLSDIGLYLFDGSDEGDIDTLYESIDEDAAPSVE